MSARARLTISFTLLFGAIVTALAIATYVLVSNDAYSRFDAALQVATGATAMSGEHELAEHRQKRGGERDLQAVLDDAGSAALGDTEILVRENGRNAVYRRGTAGGVDLRNIPDAALRNGSTINGYRLAARTFRVENFNTTYQIFAAKPVAALAEQLWQIRVTLLLLVPLCLALAALAGDLLAQKFLRPLQQFAQTVDAISSSDLSARVHLKNPGEEIGTLALRFNSLLDRLEQAFTMRRRFMADASHQLRTPVTVALVAAQVASRDTDSNVSEYKESLRTIEHQMLQLRRTVKDMFFLSQTDDGSLRIQRRPMYLDDAVTEAARGARALAQSKQQSITVEGLREARCYGDEDLLKQAILILLDNAVKYTPEGGRIEVKLERSGSDWLCFITNSGVGISHEAQQHVFDRFFREKAAGAETVPGSGLGLAIAKSIAEKHFGTLILVESRAGRTTFRLSIPVPADEAGQGTIQANSFAVRM